MELTEEKRKRGVPPSVQGVETSDKQQSLAELKTFQEHSRGIPGYSGHSRGIPEWEYLRNTIKLSPLAKPISFHAYSPEYSRNTPGIPYGFYAFPAYKCYKTVISTFYASKYLHCRFIFSPGYSFGEVHVQNAHIACADYAVHILKRLPH